MSKYKDQLEAYYGQQKACSECGKTWLLKDWPKVQSSGKPKRTCCLTAGWNNKKIDAFFKLMFGHILEQKEKKVLDFDKGTTIVIQEPSISNSDTESLFLYTESCIRFSIENLGVDPSRYDTQTWKEQKGKYKK